MTIALSSLIYYPIKACRGFEVPAWEVERMGLRDDWAMQNLDTVVVDKDGVALIRDWINALPK